MDPKSLFQETEVLEGCQDIHSQNLTVKKQGQMCTRPGPFLLMTEVENDYDPMTLYICREKQVLGELMSNFHDGRKSGYN